MTEPPRSPAWNSRFVALPPAWAVTDAEGEASLFLAPGTVGEIQFLAAGNQLVRRAVTVPAEGNESVLLIAVPDVRDMGVLDLRLAAPEGLSIAHAQLTIRSAGIEVVTEQLRNGSVRVPLPAGTYSGSLLARNLKWVPDAPATFASMDVVEPFVIRGGTTLERTEAWTRTARLSARVRPREPAEPVTWKAWLQPASGEDEPVLLKATEQDIAGEARPWNETLYSNLLEPGAYVFHLEAEGYQPWQREVEPYARPPRTRRRASSNARSRGPYARAPCELNAWSANANGRSDSSSDRPLRIFHQEAPWRCLHVVDEPALLGALALGLAAPRGTTP